MGFCLRKEHCPAFNVRNVASRRRSLNKYQNDSTCAVTVKYGVSKSYARYYCTNYTENVEYMNAQRRLQRWLLDGVRLLVKSADKYIYQIIGKYMRRKKSAWARIEEVLEFQGFSIVDSCVFGWLRGRFKVIRKFDRFFSKIDRY